MAEKLTICLKDLGIVTEAIADIAYDVTMTSRYSMKPSKHPPLIKTRE